MEITKRSYQGRREQTIANGIDDMGSCIKLKLSDMASRISERELLNKIRSTLLKKRCHNTTKLLVLTYSKKIAYDKPRYPKFKPIRVAKDQ